MKRSGVFFAMLFLASCAPTRYKTLCPPVVHYSLQEEKKAADELHAHPELYELFIMMQDYGNERREIETSVDSLP